jgi:hypothetical protein
MECGLRPHEDRVLDMSVKIVHRCDRCGIWATEVAILRNGWRSSRQQWSPVQNHPVSDNAYFSCHFFVCNPEVIYL